MTITKSKLAEALVSGRLAITAECLPPRSTDAGAVKKLSSVLAPKLDAVVVPDNPGEIQGSALACAAMLAGEGRSSVLSMVTRGRNRVALESASSASAATTSPWALVRRRPASTTSIPSSSSRL
jgi:methylenetetrahydrofolate reductase (NADPH)